MAGACRIGALVLAAAALLLAPWAGGGEALGSVHGLRLLSTIERYYGETFDTPLDIFVSLDDEEIYLVDGGRSEVFIFDLEGTPIFRFGRRQGVSNPTAVAVRDGLIYLSQEGKDYIEIFNYRGESVGRIAPDGGVPFSPGKMRFDVAGNLYVVNKARSTCIVFDSELNYVGAVGRRFNSLTAVAVSEERVYLITPYEEQAVNVYGLDGAFIMSYEALETRGGTLGLPIDGRVDASGNLWLVDALRGVVVYDRDGRERWRFDRYGTARGEVFFPVDIDFGRENMVYLLEKGTKRISVFRMLD